MVRVPSTWPLYCESDISASAANFVSASKESKLLSLGGWMPYLWSSDILSEHFLPSRDFTERLDKFFGLGMHVMGILDYSCCLLPLLRRVHIIRILQRHITKLAVKCLWYTVQLHISGVNDILEIASTVRKWFKRWQVIFCLSPQCFEVVFLAGRPIKQYVNITLCVQVKPVVWVQLLFYVTFDELNAQTFPSHNYPWMAQGGRCLPKPENHRATVHASPCAILSGKPQPCRVAWPTPAT